jgi:hypothetical protein
MKIGFFAIGINFATVWAPEHVVFLERGTTVKSKWLPPWVQGSNHSEHRIQRRTEVLTVLKTECQYRWKARTLSTGSASRPNGTQREGSSTWNRLFEEGAIILGDCCLAAIDAGG